MTLRTLNYGNYGIFLIMGNAGFCPSTVGFRFWVHCLGFLRVWVEVSGLRCLGFPWVWGDGLGALALRVPYGLWWRV